MGDVRQIIAGINAILWNETWIFVIAGTGVLFTLWSGFSQYRALTHGVRVVTGAYDDPDDPGAISHFQALACALSGTVGLGNISGVALAIMLGGPGAMFWMWIVGFLGMAIKLTEVTLSMLYRNTDDPDNPHGGPMWVADKAVSRLRPELKWLGKTLAVLFSLCIMLSAITGGNMFQAWSVADITTAYFGVDGWISGLILSIAVGAVLIGGIKRIGLVAGKLVPLMVALYVIAGSYVLFANYEQIPSLIMLMATSAFSSTDAAGAFIGGTAGSAFMFGMKRAVFSNEAGQGSSPMAHAAAKTDEPVREGIVAGMEPFIDTIVVCTFTALIIMSTGIWNRAPDLSFEQPPVAAASEAGWQFADTRLAGDDWRDGETVTMVVRGDENRVTGDYLHKITGVVSAQSGDYRVRWVPFASDEQPIPEHDGFYREYVGATLTARAFDSVRPGLGKWLITIASWAFAVSTIIAWGYYGEQGVVYIFGGRGAQPYRYVYCLMVFIATLGFIKTSSDLDNLSGIGLGVIVYANLPILWIFGYQAMRAYKDYLKRLGDERPGADHTPPTIDELLDSR